MARAIITAICLWCGITFRLGKAHRAGRYCSHQCYYDHKHHRAERRKYINACIAVINRCHRQIARTLHKIKHPKTKPLIMNICCICGQPYRSAGDYSRTCGDECNFIYLIKKNLSARLAADAWRRTPAGRAHRRIHRIKRKAAKRAPGAERIDPIEIFTRDRWKCQLCGVRVLKKMRGTYHPRAPELDHIVPLSQGGEHAEHNVQCSCRKCNGAKSSRILGQLRINLYIPGGGGFEQKSFFFRNAAPSLLFLLTGKNLCGILLKFYANPRGWLTFVKFEINCRNYGMRMCSEARMVEKTGETSQGTGAPGDQPGESEPGTIEASGDAIIVADALGGIAAALDRLAAAVERLAAPEEDEDENPRRYLDGSIIPR